MNPTLHHILTHPFTWGLVAGLAVAAVAFYHMLRAKMDVRRVNRHLKERVVMEAETHTERSSEVDRLKKENENLRVKVGARNTTGEGRLARELEIYARAERRMQVSIPGFAAPWENAKQEALGEIQGEETGRAPFKQVFAPFLPGSRGTEREALPGAPASQS